MFQTKAVRSRDPNQRPSDYYTTCYYLLSHSCPVSEVARIKKQNPQIRNINQVVGERHKYLRLPLGELQLLQDEYR